MKKKRTATLLALLLLGLGAAMLGKKKGEEAKEGQRVRPGCPPCPPCPDLTSTLK